MGQYSIISSAYDVMLPSDSCKSALDIAQFGLSSGILPVSSGALQGSVLGPAGLETGENNL